MPVFDLNFISKDARFWSTVVIQALLIALVLFAISWLFYAVNRASRVEPPLEIKALDSLYLGQLCPGSSLDINNVVTVKEPGVLVYYVSVMDANETFNYPGTQTILSGFTHPKPSMFRQSIPWVVPNLEDGLYTRIFASRGADGVQKAVFVKSHFRITGELCHE